MLSFWSYALVSVNISNISDILGVILTGVNVFVSFKISQYNKDSAKYQNESLKQQREQFISDQATKVYIHTISTMAKSIIDPYDKNIYQPILIGNSSNEPVYKVFIISINNKSDFHTEKERHRLEVKNKDNSSTKLSNNYGYLQILMPGCIYKVTPSFSNAMGGTRTAATISFTDSRGHKWLRDPQGNLIPLDKTFDICKFYGLDPTNIYMDSRPARTKNYSSQKDLFKDYKRL